MGNHEDICLVTSSKSSLPKLCEELQSPVIEWLTGTYVTGG